eukprot:TRINITY_DN39204_c0_g1_i1.p1 TRINITY_DN39204_c0_g1~~TRINITY_DN39204_c0_g1_i1.p1  ORF type:complete len:131 (+),score=37.19 TRINITY_DN39204_c0_g1_i1:113-505(+)
MIRRPPRSTLSSSSAASDVYKRQILSLLVLTLHLDLNIVVGTGGGVLGGCDCPLPVVLSQLVLGPHDVLLHRPHLLELPLEVGLLSLGRGNVGTDGAVSYTHLRAHETPEHLVCRLLLEKKKKKYNSNAK